MKYIITQEDKRLLHIELCSRLPYGVICKTEKGDGHLCSINQTIFGYEYGVNISPVKRDYFNDKGQAVAVIKPYLRSMSSMTEEEKEELKQEHCKDEKLYAECLTKAAQGDNSMRGKVIIHFAVDWCNKNHFDYCGLIPMGLALEAPEDMYKVE